MERIKPHVPSPEEAEAFRTIEQLINEGWQFEGNIHSLDKKEKRHCYRITLRRGEEERSFSSDVPYPRGFDAKGKAL